MISLEVIRLSILEKRKDFIPALKTLKNSFIRCPSSSCSLTQCYLLSYNLKCYYLSSCYMISFPYIAYYPLSFCNLSSYKLCCQLPTYLLSPMQPTIILSPIILQKKSLHLSLFDLSSCHLSSIQLSSYHLSSIQGQVGLGRAGSPWLSQAGLNQGQSRVSSSWVHERQAHVSRINPGIHFNLTFVTKTQST